jgi:hypothetical protein
LKICLMVRWTMPSWPSFPNMVCVFPAPVCREIRVQGWADPLPRSVEKRPLRILSPAHAFLPEGS